MLDEFFRPSLRDARECFKKLESNPPSELADYYLSKVSAGLKNNGHTAKDLDPTGQSTDLEMEERLSAAYSAIKIGDARKYYESLLKSVKPSDAVWYLGRMDKALGEAQASEAVLDPHSLKSADEMRLVIEEFWATVQARDPKLKSLAETRRMTSAGFQVNPENIRRDELPFFNFGFDRVLTLPSKDRYLTGLRLAAPPTDRFLLSPIREGKSYPSKEFKYPRDGLDHFIIKDIYPHSARAGRAGRSEGPSNDNDEFLRRIADGQRELMTWEKDLRELPYFPTFKLILAGFELRKKIDERGIDPKRYSKNYVVIPMDGTVPQNGSVPQSQSLAAAPSVANDVEGTQKEANPTYRKRKAALRGALARDQLIRRVVTRRGGSNEPENS